MLVFVNNVVKTRELCKITLYILDIYRLFPSMSEFLSFMSEFWNLMSEFLASMSESSVLMSVF